MRGDEFVRFAFLAATPAREGELAWKALQRYSDGAEQAWIGPPGSDNPAAVTRVSATVPRENAGGEGTGGEGTAGDGETAPQEAAAGTPTPTAGGESGAADDEPLALVLGIAGLVLGATALVVALRRRPRPGATRDAW
jgi:hypothetical protein